MSRRRLIAPLLVCAVIAAGIGATTGLTTRALATSCIEQDQLHALSKNQNPPGFGEVPIIFVHGITSSYRTWTSKELNGGASISSRVAAVPGTSVWGFDYAARSLDWVTDTAIGPTLARAITCLARIAGKRVVLIDHSMGGLATEFAAGQRDGTGTVANHIAEVITLGTPFRGSKLLTAFQLAVRGGEYLADPGAAAAAEALLSACAGLSKAEIAPGNNNPCSLLSVLRSPIGTALEYNSPEIAALPPWSPELPVNNIDGNIDLTLSLFFRHHTFDLGDIPVSHDSAVAHNTDRAPFNITCSMNGLNNLVSGNFLNCYHGNLTKNPEVVGYVVSLVSRLVARQHPGPPSTTTPSPQGATTSPSPPTTPSGPSTTPATSGVPTCSEYEQMSDTQKEQAVVAMQAAHHDSMSPLVARASVGLFCKVYPDHTIDGVYNGNL